jgi:hypothetical protein
MMARLGKTSMLEKIERKVHLSTIKSRSWFLEVKTISQQYDLPDPLLILKVTPIQGYLEKID